MIRRAAEHAEGEIGDAAMPQHAPLQVLARAWAQEINRMAGAILFVGESFAVGGIGLHVVERGHGRGRVAKRRMAGDVVDPLAADIENATIAQRFQVFLARAQHRPLLRYRYNSSMMDGRTQRPCLPIVSMSLA